MTSYVRKLLTLIMFVCIALASSSGLGASESSIKFGYWPESIDPATYQPDWASLTHVAFTSWHADSNGNILPSEEYVTRFNVVRDQAHNHGCKVLINVGASQADLDTILANHKQDFADSALSIIKTYQADGIILDFEGISQTNSITKTPNSEVVEEFIYTLSTTLKASNSDYLVMFVEPPNVRYDMAFRNSDINKSIDYVFLMGYDYRWGTSNTGSVSPFNDPTQYDVVDAVSDLSKYYDKSKIILGMPFFGYNWVCTGDFPGAKPISYSYIYMKDAIVDTHKYGRIWDKNSNTPFYIYDDKNSHHQVWYDDDESLKLKYDYAISENLGGVGYFALGYEGNNATIWKSLS